MADANWGEARLAARIAARKRRSGLVAAGVIGAVVGIPLVARLIDGSRRAPASTEPQWAEAATLVAWIGIVPLALWWRWRDQDEVERGSTLTAFAATGLAAFLFYPFYGLLHPVYAIPKPEVTGWLVAVGAGAAVRLGQRVRAWRR